MTNFKGTKGKWEIFKPNHIGLTNVSFGENNGFNPFIELWHHLFDNEKEEAEANAKLIAHAPEMLEMLFNVKDYLGSDVREQVEQLIKKATE